MLTLITAQLSVRTMLLPTLIVALPLLVLFHRELRSTPDSARISFSQQSDQPPHVTVDSDVAATPLSRIAGLSNYTEPPTGLLFVHPIQLTHGYVMRDMDFAIDIVFINSDGKVTELYSDLQPDSSDTYTGVAKHVLELPAGSVDAYGISVGDEATITFPNDSPST